MAEAAPPVGAAATTTAGSDLSSRLDHLKAQATQQYSLKNYGAAADFYSEAAEVQDEINGEMSVENADLLYHYGRCLYHVAVQNSDVLGSKVAGSEEPKRKKRKVNAAASAEGTTAGNGEGSSSSATAGTSVIGDAMRSGEQGALPGQQSGKDAASGSKPFFQITGDENWTDSEDEGEEDADGEGEGEGQEEIEDDFATAYEILDMARVLLARKIESVRSTIGADDASTQIPAEIRQLEERLADTHDLQAEISLENERFTDAIHDTRDALTLKLHLYPPESSLVAEAHYKLSLALEFASVTSTQDGPDGDKVAAAVDEPMRAEAAAEMEKAIASCKLRIDKETATLSSLSGEKAADLQRALVDIKDMVGDMEQRLVDLRKPAASLSGLQQAADGSGDEAAALRGVLGAMLGESKAGQQKLLAEATAQANDLSGMVKKGKRKQVDSDTTGATASATTSTLVEGKGKRKAEEDSSVELSEAVKAPSNGNGKKVKFEEPPKDGQE